MVSVVRYITLLTVILCVALADAAEFYVSKTGSNANDCTAAQNPLTAKLTISSALGCESAGDTIWVGDGTYAETGLGSLITPGTSESARTAIRAINRGAVEIMPSTTGQAILLSGKAYVHLDGLVINATNASNDALKLESNSHHVLLEFLELTGSKTQGLLVQGSPNGILRDSWVHDNGNTAVNGQLWHGVYLNTGSDDWTIERNELSWNSQMGIQLYASPKRATFRYNFVHHNCQKVGHGGSEMVVAHQDHTLAHNIIWSEGDCGSGVTINLQTPARARLSNMTIACTGTCSGSGVSITASNTGVIVENGVILGWNTNINDAAGDTTLTTNRTTGTPSAIWKDSANGDFAQIAVAVTIDAGTNVGLVYCGSLPDQGAHETCGPISASIDGRTLDLTVDTAFAPWQLTSGVIGWSVACSVGAGCGTPTLNSMSVISGAPSIIRFDIAGITDNACHGDETWTISHNSVTGSTQDSANIGRVKNQNLLSFTDFAVTNNCTVGGGGGGSTEPTYPGTPYIHYRFNGDNVDEVAGRNATLNGTSFVASTYDQGLQTDAGENDYAELPYGDGVDMDTQDLTIAFAYTITDDQVGTTKALFGAPLAGTNQRLYIVAVNGTIRPGVQNYAASTASELTEQVGTNHVCLTNNASTNTVTLWLNGVAGTSTSAVRTHTGYALTGGNLRVGLPINFATSSAKAVVYEEFVLYQSVEDCASIFEAYQPSASPWNGTIVAAATRPYQIKVDSLTARIPLAANNTCVTLSKYAAFAGVWQIDGTAADPSPLGFSAYYSCALCPSAGAVLPVPDTATPDGVRFFNASESGLISGNHGTQLVGGYTIVGGATHMTSNSIQVVDLEEDNSTLQTYGFQFDGAVAGREYRFRLKEQSGLALDSHTTAGELCVIAGEPSAGAGF